MGLSVHIFLSLRSTWETKVEIFGKEERVREESAVYEMEEQDEEERAEGNNVSVIHLQSKFSEDLRSVR